MRLVWTEAAKKEVTPRSREDIIAPAKLAAPKEYWEAIRGRNDQAAQTAARFVDGRAQATPEMASLMERAGEAIASVEPPTTLPADVVAALILLLENNYRTNDILSFVRVTDGLPRALEAFILAHRMNVASRTPNKPYVATLVAEPHTTRMHTEGRLRAALILADDATYATCLELARAAWPTASLALKTMLAYRFPREITWNREVAQMWLDSPLTPAGVPSYAIYANLDDFDLATRLYEKQTASSQLFDLVAMHGEKAFPLVLKTLRSDSPNDLKHAAAVAMLFEADEVAAELANALGKSKVRPYATAYFSDHPDLARKFLGDLSRGKTRVAGFAQEILAQIDRAATSAAGPRALEASPEELPAILRDPPWTRKKRPKRALVVVTNLKSLAREERLDPPASTYAPTHLLNLKLELPSVAGLVKYVTEHLPAWYLAPAIILSVHSKEFAMPMAKLADDRQYGATAWKWIYENFDLALVGLIEAAVGEDSPRRALAERMLRRLALKGKKAEIERVADEYGADARKSIDETLAWDSRYDCPKSPPKLPPFCKLESFTTPKLANGKSLSRDAVTHIAEMLSFTKLDPPYVGIDEVRDACEPRSLAEFSWDLARAWEIAGAKKTGLFMLFSLAHFADDEVTRRTTPAIKDRRILEVLRHLGTEAATMELATIAARANVAPSPYVTGGGGAEAMLAEIAQSKGITKDDLDDRLAPTTPLTEEGLTLDFGERTFRVTFDSKLEPIAVDAENKRSPQFPAKRKTDDAAKVKLAQVKWNEIREDVMAIGLRRIASLERAMMSHRTWDAARFREVWIDAPFMHYLSEAVVWITDDGQSFRIAEDRSFANEHDEAIVLSETARVGVAHPMRMGTESTARWRTLFDEYGVIQPFLQVNRIPPNHALAPAELDATQITRPVANAPNGSLLATHFMQRGFSASMNGRVTTHRRAGATRTGAPIRVEITHEAYSNVGSVTLQCFAGDALVLTKDVDPADMFEALRDIALYHQTTK